MTKSATVFLSALLCLSFSLCEGQISASVSPDDTLTIYETNNEPVIDGSDKDQCWETLTWQPIDQPWIPYGESVSSSDYRGAYKILWSKKSNLLYFAVSITDDVYVDGYRYDKDPKKGDFYYNFDLLEVFIDADRSGGLHVFNGDSTSAFGWGMNSYNAFSYHMILDEPENGSTARSFTACDLDGRNWSDYFIAEYSDHFNDFAMRKVGNTYLWEFSLKVFDESYSADQPKHSRVILKENDVMGISLAYCDNDGRDEQPKIRDNFFGSVSVPEKAQNDHWMNADLYRRILLIGDTR